MKTIIINKYFSDCLVSKVKNCIFFINVYKQKTYISNKKDIMQDIYTKKELILFLENKTKAVSYLSNKIKNIEVDTPFNDKLLSSILQYHPNNEEKDVKNICYLMIKHHPTFKTKTIYIKTKNKDITDISYKQCIDVLFEKYNKKKQNYNDILSAFRNCVCNTKKKEFYLKSDKICILCNSVENIQVDHYPISFSKILDDFVDENKINIYNLKTFEKDNLIFLESNDIQNAFILYHDEKALFRMLCKSCNCSLGNGNYKVKYTFKNNV